MYQLNEFFGDLVVDVGRTFGALTLFPLLRKAHADPDYGVLAPAIAAGSACVTEISAGGSVPELMVENKGTRNLLIIDGEELHGAKQNRVVNLTILVPPGRALKIPVSCTEAGRWRPTSSSFSSSPQTMYPRARGKKTARVSESMRRGGTYRSDQAEVWLDIDLKSAAMGASSATKAMGDIYLQQSKTIDEYVRAFEPSANQIGAVYAIGGDVVGVEGFDAPATWVAYAPKLVRGYALDAMECRDLDPASPPLDAAREWLERIREAHSECFPALGVGEDLRLRAETLHGAALALEGRIVHLAAFASEMRRAS